MSGSRPPERMGKEQFVAWDQPVGGDDGAQIFVLNEAEDLLVASGAVGAPVLDVADWDAVLTSLGFTRTSSWTRYRRSMRCTAELAS
ncbi:hypothetical protein [Jiangella endophytica]|uniref:hypothetical protein n=1 Tax=Jiangella endophytica TaxID=1623398 RepID=UPI0013002643|nr:hypothetical protein [Jiangella endophytica]